MTTIRKYNRAVDLWSKGCKAVVIAREMGMTEGGFAAMRHRHRDDFPRRNLPAGQDEPEVAELRSRSRSYRWIANELARRLRKG